MQNSLVRIPSTPMADNQNLVTSLTHGSPDMVLDPMRIIKQY